MLVTLSNIGDLVMTTPALIALHEAWPEAQIDIVADQRSSILLAHCPFVGEIFIRDKTAGLAGVWQLVRQLRERAYLAAVDLRTDFLPWLLRAQQRSMRWLVRHEPPAPHAVERHLQVVKRVVPGLSRPPAPRVWWPAAASAWANAQKATLPGRVLALAPGANWAGKCWPLERYIELARLLAPRFDGLLLLGSAAEREAAAAIAQQVNKPSLNLAGSTGLLEVAALLPLCAAFVGNDSGIGHLAAAAAIPTLTVFGPGQPARYRPWGARAAIICAPGGQLAALPAHSVADALDEHLRALPAVAYTGD